MTSYHSGLIPGRQPILTHGSGNEPGNEPDNETNRTNPSGKGKGNLGKIERTLKKALKPIGKYFSSKSAKTPLTKSTTNSGPKNNFLTRTKTRLGEAVGNAKTALHTRFRKMGNYNNNTSPGYSVEVNTLTTIIDRKSVELQDIIRFLNTDPDLNKKYRKKRLLKNIETYEANLRRLGKTYGLDVPADIIGYYASLSMHRTNSNALEVPRDPRGVRSLDRSRLPRNLTSPFMHVGHRGNEVPF